MDERTIEALAIDIPEELLCELTIAIDVSQTIANRTAEAKAFDLTLRKIAEDVEIASLTEPNILGLKRLVPALTRLAARALGLVVAIEKKLGETQ